MTQNSYMMKIYEETNGILFVIINVSNLIYKFAKL